MSANNEEEKEWCTWLVYQGAPRKTTQHVLRSTFKASDGPDPERPIAGLGLHNGKVMLWTANEKEFFAWLDKRIPDEHSSILALSAAPSKDLQHVNGQLLWSPGASYEVSWLGAGSDGKDNPYRGRFLRIGKKYRLHVPKHVAEKMIGIDGAPKDLPPLLLEPIRLSLSPEEAVTAAWFSESNRDGPPDLWFLTPVRADEHPDRADSRGFSEEAGSYFSSDRLQFRQRLRAVARIIDEGREEPVAVLIHRLTDDPALRDILLDGGALCVEGGEGAPTRIALEVRQPADDQLSEARSALVLGDSSYLDHLPACAKELAREIRRDIELIVPGGNVRIAKGKSVDWSTTPKENGNATTVGSTGIEGHWQHLLALHKRLIDNDATREAGLLWDLVLRRSDLGDSQYNHPYALRLFSINFWRQPWVQPDQATASWSQATGDLLVHELVGKPETPEERSERLWVGHILKSKDPLTFSYQGNPAFANVLEWRLLYPLGTVINARTLLLDRDHRSWIGSGLVLA